jgi:hypothetical protein
VDDLRLPWAAVAFRDPEELGARLEIAETLEWMDTVSSERVDRCPDRFVLVYRNHV